ncbi:MAG TPA: 3-deoxy-manno-octulosonate cytidylyltransferase [Candidatus Acidoferrum sp.]|nr:3-deoxy-manno-octulosonate cytidylyltransferase [Candidatus Acidoferrum sp.]
MTDPVFIAVIPARFQSSRLPGKMLLDLAGQPMILRVAERVRQSGASAVYVATDNDQIRNVCADAGVNVCMTHPAHQSGTDRIAEVTYQLDLPDEALIVNVQGDEPLIPPAVIDQVARNLAQRPEVGICTLYADIHDGAEFRNANAVKLVTDEAGNVLYFSRAPIPWPRDGHVAGQPYGKRHIGIYGYRARVLRQFVQWPPSALEQTEKLEQLRAMEHGVRIHAERCQQTIPPGVDTAEDLEHVRRLLTAVK